MNRDGSGLRRLTNHPAIDVTPTWSPTGTQIAFTSDRSRLAADLRRRRRRHWACGGSRPSRTCDRPTWSPAPYNEIAYAVADRAGVRHQDHRPGERRACGRSRSARAATRARRSRPTAATWRSRPPATGKQQIFTIDRTGRNLRPDHDGRATTHAGLVALNRFRLARSKDETEKAMRTRSWTALRPRAGGGRWPWCAGACAQEDAAGGPARSMPPPPPTPADARAAARAARAGGEKPVVPEPAIGEDTMASRSLDDLNRDSPLKPVFFGYDSAEVDARGAAGAATPTPRC